jgi:serine protease Do
LAETRQPSRAFSGARPPAWLVYIPLLALLLTAAYGRREDADAPPAPPPLAAGEGAVLARASPIDPAVMIRVRARSGPDAGVAFSVADSGVWLTAGKTLAACVHPAVMVGDTEGEVTRVMATPGGPVAVLTTPAGAPALPLATGRLRGGEPGYAAGFPRGRPGELALRLLGRATLPQPGRGSPGLPVLAWAEIGRTQGLAGDLPALPGSPVLDGEGRVVGLALAESPRRGLVYSTTPEALAAALAATKAPHAPQAAGAVITPDNYGLAADDLRRALRIAPVACVRR